jgi:hypothetical protein
MCVGDLESESREEVVDARERERERERESAGRGRRGG